MSSRAYRPRARLSVSADCRRLWAHERKWFVVGLEAVARAVSTAVVVVGRVPCEREGHHRKRPRRAIRDPALTGARPLDYRVVPSAAGGVTGEVRAHGQHRERRVDAVDEVDAVEAGSGMAD